MKSKKEIIIHFHEKVLLQYITLDVNVKTECVQAYQLISFLVATFQSVLHVQILCQCYLTLSYMY